MGQVLPRGVTRSGASGGGRNMGQRLVSTISWRRLGGLRKVTGGFDEGVLG